MLMLDETKDVRILLVEDDLDLQEMMTAVLLLNGYEVMVADDGEQAFQLLERFTPDIIVSDYKMPRMDGLALRQKLFTNMATKKIPFLMMSGFPPPVTPVDVEILQKPVSMELLRQKIQSTLYAARKH